MQTKERLTKKDIDNRIERLKAKNGNTTNQALLALQIKNLNGVKKLIEKRDLLWEKNQKRKG